MIEDKTRLKTFLKKSVTEFLFHEIRNQKTRSHATWTIAVADVYVYSVKRFLQTSQTFIFILLS